MAYIAYKFAVAEEATVELLIALLANAGFDSFDQQEDGLKAFISKDLVDQVDVKEILSISEDLKGLHFEQEKLEEKNWNEEWESNFHPILVGEELAIRASFHKLDHQPTYDLIIDPKMSFGTGHHATTLMMVKAMLSIDFTKKNVLDMGSGTAVLAILARKRGADEILAIDNEEWAYKNAQENIATNMAEPIKTILGESDSIPDTRFDIILANINRNVILEDIGKWAQHLQTDGTMLLSGILVSQEADVLSAAGHANLSAVEKLTENGWICLKLAFNK